MNSSIAKFSALVAITLTTAACTGTRPAHLGLAQSELQPCPDSPNCVSSLAPVSDTGHFIPAIASDDPGATLKAIAQELSKHPAEIIVEDQNYLYAEFTSSLMRYVDDVEFLYMPGKEGIQVRSASRLGYKDFDVNRERIESIRQALQSK